MPDEPRCQTCRHWDGIDACRRYPPQVVAMKHVIWNGKETHLVERTFWPEAAAMDWCGEWAAGGVSDDK